MLTAVGSLPPVTKFNSKTGTCFGIVAQSNTQALDQIGTTVTSS